MSLFGRPELPSPNRRGPAQQQQKMTILSSAPVLSTPAEFLFERADSDSLTEPKGPRKTDDELREIYEVARTARELRQEKWKRIALQFPDSMLVDAPRLVQALKDELNALPKEEESGLKIAEKIFILADTSYSACCVDEVAAEHADAQVVVHYGRSCLSPTSRLPVIYVFTEHLLNLDETVQAFCKEYPDKGSKVVIMADVTYQSHIPAVASYLASSGYTNIFSTTITHDPTNIIPNRKIVSHTSSEDTPSPESLKEYSLFHISTPPTALLLALSSRVANFYVHPTPNSPFPSSSLSARRLLGRRYAKLLSLSTAGIIGILVNTLSVSNYLSSVNALKKRIAAVNKKSYIVVVGKLNPAKLANFAEIDGWVVVGCWESSLVEDDAGFFQPVVTPFELEIALQSDDERVWGGEWWGGIEGVKGPEDRENGDGSKDEVWEDEANEDGNHLEENDDSEEESAPPEFDLRTGKLVSTSRPMRVRKAKEGKQNEVKDEEVKETQRGGNGALTLRPKAELAMVNGVVSPGAEFLRSQRTWQGLGSDYTEEESTAIAEGRKGVARGYTTGDSEKR